MPDHPARTYSSTSSFSPIPPTELRKLSAPGHKERRRPLSWSERIRNSLFYQPDATSRWRSRSRGEGERLGQATMLPVQGFNKGESLADIGEIPQAQRKQQISEAGTVKMPLRADTIREADAPPPVPGAQVGHSRKRTVSHEDYLTGRGANPRTGIISPSISSSSNTSDDHLSHRELLNHWNTQMSKKWRLKGDQWISLGKDEKTPLPSPSSKKSSIDPDIDAEEKVRSYIRRFHRRGVPLSQVEDRFVVHMPSAREPCPPTMTGEQILEFQKAIDKLYKNGECTLDSSSLLPPQPNQEGQRSPGKKLSKRRLHKLQPMIKDEMHSVTERDHHVDAFDGRNPFLGVAAKVQNFKNQTSHATLRLCG